MRCITSAHNKTHNHTKNTEFDISKKSTISKQIQQYPIIIIIIIFNVLRIVGKFWTGVPAQFSQKNWSIQNLGQEDKRANRKQLKAISGKIKVSQNFSLCLIYSIYVWLFGIKLCDFFFLQRHSEVTSRYLSSSAMPTVIWLHAIYESFSDVGEIRVYFASKILTPCRMH